MPSIGTRTSRGTSPRPDTGDTAGQRTEGAGLTVPCQRQPTPLGLVDADLLERFGQPSNYSLAAHELAAHIRQLRRSGWQSWEIRVRFDYREAA